MAADVNAPAVMRLSPRDNIAVALRPLKAGESVLLDGVELTVERHTPVGRKLAAQSISAGDVILKYSCPIGTATRAIAPGEYIDKHNVEVNYLPTYTPPG
jgi:SAF domain